MKANEKQKAIGMRQEGRSIKEIANLVGVSKGSVSLWVRDVKLSNQKILKLKEREHGGEVVEKRRLSRLRNELNKRNAILNDAKKDIKSISKDDLRLIGSMLYWAEGRKRGRRILSFSNSDPLTIKVMMKFFKDIFNVEDGKFRGHIHTHSHLNAREAEIYWAEVSGIPLGQFYKTYSKPSKAGNNKMDSLPYGTFDICVNDSKLFLKVMGWIKKISELVID